MRENFHLMRALAEHTRVSPKARIDKLMIFNRRLRQEQAIVDELSEWNMKLDERLTDVPARILQPENIVLGGNRIASAGQFANWTRELHNKPMFSSARLSNWVLISMSRMRRDVEVKYFRITFYLLLLLTRYHNALFCRGLLER